MKYEVTYQSRTNEINVRDYLKPTQLIQYLQETAESQITALDLDYIDLYNKRRKAFLVSRLGVEIYRPIYRYAKLTGRTWVTEGRAANFPRAYELYCDGEAVARAYSNWALVDVDTRRLIRFKDYDCSAYPVDELPAMRIPERFRIPGDVPLHFCGVVSVGFSLTDINRHMNNTQYFNILYDRIPDVDLFDVTSINIRFVHEAAYGNEMEIYRSEIVWKSDQEGLVGGLDPAAEGVIFFRSQTDGETNVEAVYGLRKY
ncbi:MAG: hypothetical protein IJH91_01750 [Mogibacterium sp.]|nr:hypothetical protein [Mogibacterium sp.]